MNVLISSSDNNATSGAFLCLVQQCKLLLNNYDIKPIVVLPCKGNGQALLEDIGIESYIIRSSPWVIQTEGMKDSAFIKYVIKAKIKNVIAEVKTAELIKRKNIDIVHLNTIWTYAAAISALLTGRPFVWHIRESLEEGQKQKLINKKSCYRLMKKASKIVGVSDYILGLYKDIFDDKMTRIYEGIDIGRFNSEHKIFENNITRILSVGAMYENKGQQHLIEACKILRTDGVNSFHIDFVGGGEDEEKLKKMVLDYNLENLITFHGVKTNVSDYYLNSDIFVMSSRGESFGRTTVEALCSGCLVIGSDSTATPELLQYGEYGLLFEKENSEDLAEKIMYAMMHKNEMQSIAKFGQKYAAEKFTDVENTKEICNLYSNVLGSINQNMQNL